MAHLLVQHVEAHGQIIDEQWEGRKGKQSIDLVCVKSVFLHILHMGRQNGSIMDLDAKHATSASLYAS